MSQGKARLWRDSVCILLVSLLLLVFSTSAFAVWVDAYLKKVDTAHV